ncbi:GlxA family transcriptional regulator [Dickeya lacustris]|uniref:Helix-turn-helix domain-containing protein n=1 Tax=Dickeya lacustris TaxID=2259638 RepID=A0ABY8GAR9_9GAMM|nr:helix-turn-helix domain-containing protein [Dickeya lacustris]WFN57026.1 helix-turn-helix domain-containing protein [Dickeya lacustris]
MRIAIIAIEGSLLSAVAGLADMFWITNQTALSSPRHVATQPNTRFETIITTADGNPVNDAQGRKIQPDCAFAQAGNPDYVLMTGMALGHDRLPLNEDAIRHAADWVRQQYEQGAYVGGACAGSLVLGEAGLLDGRACTTTWWLYHTLRQRYPKAKAVWGKSLEEQDRILTSGGPLSWAALALHIVKRVAGPELAKLTADMAVADSQPLSQQLYAPPGFISTQHPLLLRAEEIIRYRHPAITAEQLAAQLNTTPRTLQRKITALTGESPKAFITRVRIESACVLLASPVCHIRKVAAACGYTEDSAFRKAFLHVMGMTPTHYRRWISDRNAASGSS